MHLRIVLIWLVTDWIGLIHHPPPPIEKKKKKEHIFTSHDVGHDGKEEFYINFTRWSAPQCVWTVKDL